MKMTIALLFLGASCFAQSEPRLWAKEPDSFHGVKFGATEAEVRSNLNPWACAPSTEGEACYFDMDLGGRQFNWVALFSKGALSEIVCVFDRQEFSRVGGILVSAYGDPSTNAENGGLRWNGDRVTAAIDAAIPTERKGIIHQISAARYKLELDTALETHQRILAVGLD